jgi:hypothetical protein
MHSNFYTFKKTLQLPAQFPTKIHRNQSKQNSKSYFSGSYFRVVFYYHSAFGIRFLFPKNIPLLWHIVMTNVNYITNKDFYFLLSLRYEKHFNILRSGRHCRNRGTAADWTRVTLAYSLGTERFQKPKSEWIEEGSTKTVK